MAFGPPPARTCLLVLHIRFPSGNPGLVLGCNVKDHCDMDYPERTGDNSDYTLGHLG